MNGFASISELRVSPVSALMLFLLLLAAWEFRRIGTWTRQARMLPPIYCGFLLLVVLLACAVYFAVAPEAGAWELSGRLLSAEIPLIVATLIFLSAALSDRAGALPRLLPVLDRYALWRKGEGGRRSPSRFLSSVLEGTGYLLAMVLFSALWLQLAVHFGQARISSDLLESMEPSADLTGRALGFHGMVLILLAPFTEEPIFRGFIFQRLATLCRKPALRRCLRSDIVLPICLSAAVWAVVHGGAIEPSWVKWVQIFGLGVGLGLARLRLGLEGCVILHLLFNLCGGFLAPSRLH